MKIGKGGGLTVAVLKQFITNNRDVLSTLTGEPGPKLSKMKRPELVQFLVTIEVVECHGLFPSLQLFKTKTFNQMMCLLYSFYFSCNIS